MTSKKWLHVATVAVPALLAGCSSVPDAINPAEWYRDAVDYFSDEEPSTAQASKTSEKPSEAKASEGTAQVAEVKKSEPAPTSGFVADTQGRKYAQAISRQGDAANVLTEENTLAEETKVASLPEPIKPAAVQSLPKVNDEKMAAASPVKLTPPQQVATTTNAMDSTSDAVNRRFAGAEEVRDNRSVQEIFAANISQRRPTAGAGMNRTANSMDVGSLQPFETVIVSGNGVTRNSGQMSASQSQQTPKFNMAALGGTQSVDTVSASMGVIESKSVSGGVARALSDYNPGAFSGSFQVATIQFSNGVAELSREDKEILRKVVAIHQQQGGAVRVVGHASSRTRNMDPTQHVNVNYEVSVERADAVAVALSKLGVDADNLFVGAVGDSQPVYREVMPAGEAGNRRTEIFIDY